MEIDAELSRVLCRVTGNAAVAFFTVLSATAIFGDSNALNSAILGAFIQGGLAGAQEFKKWAEGQRGGKINLFIF